MDEAKIDIEELIKENESLKEQLENSSRMFYDMVKKTNQHLKDLFDNSNDLIQIIKPSGELRFVNQAWKYKMGYNDDQIVDLDFIDLIHPDRKKETNEKLKAASNSPLSERFSTILVSKLGKNIYVNGNLTSVFEEGKLVEFRCIFYDVTERMRAESAQSLYFTIASHTSREQNIEQFFESIYSELNLHLRVRNFAIAIYNNDQLEFPLYINEKLSSKEVSDVDYLLTEYTVERKKPVIIYEEGVHKIEEQYHRKISGKLPKIWMGVPFYTTNSKGAMMMYSYRDHTTFNNKDLELLDFISSQVGLAIQRKQSDEKIIDQAARLEAIIESSTHHIWSINRKYEFTSFNENYALFFKKNFGVKPTIGMNLLEIHKKFLKPVAQKTWKSSYEKAFEGETINFENQLKLKGKASIWRDIYLNPIFLPDGEIQEISVIANDITERKEAEVALIESEEKFRNIFESFQDVYFRCDKKGKITMVSPSIIEVLGYSNKEVIGKNIETFFKSDLSGDELLKLIVKKKSIRNYEASSKTKSGKEIKFLCNIRMLYHASGELEFEGVARDISELIKANIELKEAKEIAERSLKVKERFLANMSHEIRTPMNGLVGMIDLLGTTELNSKQADYIKTLKLSSDNLLNILNDILDLSKIEAGKMELRKEPVNIIETIESIYDLYSQNAYSNGIELYYNLDDRLPDIIITDRTRLIQIIANLTSNAIKFSDKKGPVNISVRLLSIDKKHYVIKVSVKDSGIGISPKDQQSLFKSFSQIDSSNKKSYAGTGLGLAISKELVKLMGGDISVVSTPGLGSTFSFTFLSEVPDKSQMDEEEKHTRNTYQKFENQKPKILLVDDNDINRKVANEILKQAGCTMDLAKSGYEAIEKVKKEKYDLIFMDIQMPELDGIETTHKLKAIINDDLAPIIAMTAYSMEEDRKKFLNEGLDDYIAKPIKSDIIIGKVKEWTKFEPEIKTSAVSSAIDHKDLIINQNTLNQLYKYGGSELINSVLLDFEKEATELIKLSTDSVNENDYENIRSCMHTLKGNAGTLGIERVSKYAKNVENTLKQNKFEKLQREMKKLKQSFEEFQRSYKNLINN